MWVNRSKLSASEPFRPSDRAAFLEREGCLHLIADWTDVLFLNFRIEPGRLQSFVPYQLDLCEGKAWVSLVVFTMRDLRPSLLGGFGKMMFRPFSEQRFLNVRTYVKSGAERGGHFIAEWISDWLNAQLGPFVYELPYRFGRLNYNMEAGRIDGRVTAEGNEFAFNGKQSEIELDQCREATDSFLLERYAAFNGTKDRKRMFRVWHPPWMQAAAEVEITDETLLAEKFEWWRYVRFTNARYSPGVEDVLMGAPRRVVSRPR